MKLAYPVPKVTAVKSDPPDRQEYLDPRVLTALRVHVVIAVSQARQVNLGQLGHKAIEDKLDHQDQVDQLGQLVHWARLVSADRAAQGANQDLRVCAVCFKEQCDVINW